MLSIGIACPPLTGHLNPMLALGTELKQRGHRVVVFTVEDYAGHVAAHGLTLGRIGAARFPAGSIPAWQHLLQKQQSAQAIELTVELLRDYALTALAECPDLIRALGVQHLLVDQVEYAGSTLAQRAGLPHVTVANAFPLNREPAIPTIYSAWAPATTRLERVRDGLIYALHEQVYPFARIGRAINEQRQRWGLPRYWRERDYYSRLAQVSQCPPAFDYPRSALPAVWHGVGPMRSKVEIAPPFPFERLDGRPLVYVSLGSMQGDRRALFAAIAEACVPLGVQVVITHGHQLTPAQASGFAGNPIVVPYAPQTQLLARARLAITHAGMNTVLDALAAGVPVVAIPVTFEQPAIAARVGWLGVGEMIGVKDANVSSIRTLAARVLGEASYREAAHSLSRAIAHAGGVQRAADVVVQALTTRRPVLASDAGASFSTRAPRAVPQQQGVNHVECHPGNRQLPA